MPIRPRIKAGFEDFPLSFGHRIWQHQSRWSQREYKWYRAERGTLSLQMDRHPVRFHPKRLEIKGAVASWVLLEHEDQNPSAWAEVHMFKGSRYALGYIYVGGSTSLTVAELAPLIRLIFLIGELDLVRLISPAQVHLSVRKVFDHEHTLYTLPFKPWVARSPDLIPMKCLSISRQEWLSNSALQDAAHHTRHIESRLERQTAAEKLGKGRKRKRGLIARIFRPRVDDSIF